MTTARIARDGYPAEMRRVLAKLGLRRATMRTSTLANVTPLQWLPPVALSHLRVQPCSWEAARRPQRRHHANPLVG